MSKFVQSDPRQPLLLPVDLRDWVPEDDLSHFILAAVERIPIARFQVNERGTGSAQYHPQMMLALLVYCYANGVFGSRRIERASYRDLGARYICGDTHPDHDTICKFRRENTEAVAEGFLQVLLLARELKLLTVGTVSVDGTKLDANASKHRSVRYDRAQALRDQLRGDIQSLLEQAEAADRATTEDGQSLPEELARRDKLADQLDAACKRLEVQAGARAEAEQEEYESKVRAREKRQGRRKGKRIKPPDDSPREDEQSNLTDPDSSLMRKNKRSEYRQSYNAQAVVDAQGSQLVLASRVSCNASDRNELVADVDAIPAALGSPAMVLADNGYATEEEVEALTKRHIDVLVAPGRSAGQRRYDFRPPKPPPEHERSLPGWLIPMRERLDTAEGRDTYRLRQQTVEPVFGIIKHVLGFRQFLMRGHERVEDEWQLICLAYNVKRLHRLVQTA